MKISTKALLLSSLVCAVLSGCGGGGGGSSSTTTPTNPTPPTNPAPPPTTPPVVSANNVLPVSVNGGLSGNYLNGIFATVTICKPGTANSGVASDCQTIDNILIDTGSVGLRIMADALPSGFILPTVNNALGNPYSECTHFADGVTWGTVNSADVKLSGEIASNISVNIVGEKQFPIHSACSSAGTVNDTTAAFGAKGVLGIGLFKQDCGSGCAVNSAYNVYYTCPQTGCTQSVMPLAIQVANPVAKFPQDNNGTIIVLNDVPSTGAKNVSGNLYFGIGTQSNNLNNSLKAINTDSTGMITINYKSANYAKSFIDSGSSIDYFTDSAIPTCTSGSANGIYCPTSTQNLAMTLVSPQNGNSSVINVVVDNGQQLVNTGNIVFNNMAMPTTYLPNSSIDLGLSFFFGRQVATGIEGTSSPIGNGTYFAF